MTNALNIQQESLQLNDTISLFGIFPSFGFSGAAVGMTLGMHHTYAFARPSGMSGQPTSSGELIPIATNEALFFLIGTTYGGDGIANFALPNEVLRQSVGAGQGVGLPDHFLGESFGNATAVLPTVALPGSLGGGLQPLNDTGPQLAERYMIAVNGIFPSQGGGSGALDYIGSIVKSAFGFETGSYMECDGRTLFIADYEPLFFLIGTIYGGDGQTTFALPDLRGRTMVGAGGNHFVGEYFGDTTVNITDANLPTNMGGNGAALHNEEPSLAVTYCIATSGIFPSDNASADPEIPFLGEIIAFSGNFVPSGFAACNGQIFSITNNQALFALIGTIYGGDGVTTFALPNLQDRSIVGMSSYESIGQVVGSNDIILTSADFPDLNYSGTDSGGFHYGGDGNDTINGLGGGDLLVGNGGDDTLNGGSGGDVLEGGDGTSDTVSYSGSNAGVNVNLFLNTATGGHATGDTISGFENVTGSSQSDVIAGDGNANVLKGELGTGDMITYANSNAFVNVNLTTNAVSGGFAQGDTISGFERVIGSNFDDFLAGTVFANSLAGGGGNDTIFGDAGADNLTGGNGFDTLDHTASSGGVTINLLTNVSSGGNAQGDIIGTFERVNGSNTGVDVLTGNTAVNILRGNGGNDFIEGGAGGDTLDGGAGSADTLVYTSSNAAVVVNIGLNTASGGHAQLDIISGFERLTGSAFGDTLTGTTGTNILKGGLGSDTITGGAGFDTFVFDTAIGATNIDSITDFSVPQDTIQLDNLIFTALTDGALDATLFGFAATADTSDRIIYNQATGQLFYDTNGSTAGGSTQIATLATGLAMTAADFFVI